MDATYRTDLRELNDLNFARFETKLGERLASLESHLTWRMVAFWAPTALAVILLVVILLILLGLIELVASPPAKPAAVGQE